MWEVESVSKCKYCKEKEVTLNRVDNYYVPECATTAIHIVKSTKAFHKDDYCSELCANKDLLNMIQEVYEKAEVVEGTLVDVFYSPHNSVDDLTNSERREKVYQEFIKDKKRFFDNN